METFGKSTDPALFLCVPDPVTCPSNVEGTPGAVLCGATKFPPANGGPPKTLPNTGFSNPGTTGILWGAFGFPIDGSPGTGVGPGSREEPPEVFSIKYLEKVKETVHFNNCEDS